MSGSTSIRVWLALFLLGTSSILSVVNMARLWRVLDGQGTGRREGLSADGLEMLWNRSDASITFTNDHLPITSDEDWAYFAQPPRLHLGEESDQEYILSMHQQLYCLNLVRIAYLKLHHRPSRMHIPPGVNIMNIKDEVEGCIEQIKQNLLCNADLALEPSTLQFDEVTGGDVPVATGHGVVHRCSNWRDLESAVKRFVV